MEIKNNSGIIEILSNNSIIYFDTNSLNVKLGDLLVSSPGEYEKGGILLEVKEYDSKLFYNFTIEGKTLVLITDNNFNKTEEILSFFGDVDVLIIVGTKDSIKLYESIEAKIVLPYGDGKNIFLNDLGQNTEEVEVFKSKGEFSSEETEFVNLRMLGKIPS